MPRTTKEMLKVVICPMAMKLKIITITSTTNITNEAHMRRKSYRQSSMTSGQINASHQAFRYRDVTAVVIYNLKDS